MATFPTLAPSTRSFTPGEYPHTPFNTYNSLQNRVRHSNVMLASQLRLSFVALTESDMLSILSHYRGQYGTFESFDLPSSVWGGVTTISDYQLSGYLWRYTAPPEVDDAHRSFYNVSLALETVPPDGAQVDGRNFTITVSAVTGTAFAASGLSKTVSSSLSPGAWFTPGFDGTITTSLTAGTGAASSGVEFQITATLAAGTAAASSGAEFTIPITFAPGAVTTSGGSWIAQYYDWEPSMYEETSSIYIDWSP